MKGSENSVHGKEEGCFCEGPVFECTSRVDSSCLLLLNLKINFY